MVKTSVRQARLCWQRGTVGTPQPHVLVALSGQPEKLVSSNEVLGIYKAQFESNEAKVAQVPFNSKNNLNFPLHVGNAPAPPLACNAFLH